MKIIIGVAVLLLAAFLFFRNNRSVAGSHGRTVRPGASLNPKSGRAQPAPRPYRATSIVPGTNACGAVAELQETRFLDAQGATPALPLEGCDAGSCQCRYAHHTDRRDSSDDRRLAGQLQSQLYEANSGDERRQRRRGRRRRDLN
ncbi:hypothetical protein [Pseudomaricurvus sp. HS19]|uniref:hypothetical protein n=1 Tax=Pseudomaricurvus sp. HS19 TaxID=2692626 RepID=UPI00136E1243|nr:hypothetical protein [Pseudomaricurvus sp. HS19]MYM64261.1 hypothetical protein [Pseudomaricurvus sp. HS19]